VFDETGRFDGYRGVWRDITERKVAEAERLAQVWFFRVDGRISRAMQATNDLDRMMGDACWTRCSTSWAPTVRGCSIRAIPTRLRGERSWSARGRMPCVARADAICP
jgi:hypothetical protein